MSNLILSCQQNTATLVPNVFLDRYMPHANGEFVKVYLYLLRSAGTDRDLSLSDIADILSCTEKDVIRALRYWEKTGLCTITENMSGEIAGIAFVPFEDTGNKANMSASSASLHDGENAGSSEKPMASATQDSGQTDRSDKSDNEIPKRRQLTAARINQLEDTEDFMYLLFVSGQYLGRNLTRTDIDTLGYFYDELHMNVDLIEYLIEYCVSNNHTSIRYIETVGLAWHSEGITTVEAAKEAGRNYNKEYYEIFKALGIRNHSPISAEIQLMDKWMKTYHFSMDMIQEACTRTIMKTARPTLDYANGILTRWYNENVRTLEDVKKRDDVHDLEKSRDRKKANDGKGRKPSGSFYSFEQRTYDSDLENKLLGITSTDGKTGDSADT